MKISPESALTLLHEATHGTLATNSSQLPGYPYATVVPYVPDEAQCPVICVSALAEHTRNLLADPRVSLSVQQPGAADVQDAPRLTLVADASPFTPSAHMLARYLRYEPSAQRHLALDFMFLRLAPKRVRYIGGVGRMGWLEDPDWRALPTLPGDVEAAFIEESSKHFDDHVKVLGADCFGIDYKVGSERKRLRFTNPPVPPEGFTDLALQMIAELR